MKINKKLNLVMPLERDDGTTFHVHSTSISIDILNQYWELAGRTMAALYSRGFGMFAPRYALEMLLQLAKEDGGIDEQKQMQSVKRVEMGLLNEMKRLTNIFALGENGWELRAMDEATKNGLIDSEEAYEVLNAVVFFTFASRSHLKSQVKEWSGALNVWNAQMTYSGCTEYKNFLVTSTKVESTGETEKPPSAQS